MSTKKQLAESIYIVSKEAKKLRDENSELWAKKEETKEILFENGYKDNSGCNQSLNDLYAICPFSGIELTKKEYEKLDKDFSDMLNAIDEAESSDLEKLKKEAEDEDEELEEYLEHQDYFHSINITKFLETGEIYALDEVGEEYTEKEILEYIKEMDESKEKIEEMKNEKHEEIKELNEEIAENNEKIKEFYELKEEALQELVELGDAKVEGYHKFKIGKMDFIKFQNFTFHTFLENFPNDKNLGEIKDTISSEIKGINLELEEATKNIKLFLSQAAS